jgi:hypothetical protein
MKRPVESAEDLDEAEIEQQALGEIAELARRYIPRLSESSEVRKALMRLEARAPEMPARQARQQAA